MDKKVKKVLVLAAIFIIFDRCMNYKISQTRRKVRIAYLKHKKEIKEIFADNQLAYGKKTRKNTTT